MMDWKRISTTLGSSATKYQFYFGDYDYEDYSTGQMAKRMPKQRVGWAKRAVEIRSNKTKFDRFENDTLGFNELFSKYGVLQAFDKIKDDILICGCGFLAVSNGKVFPFSAQEATGTFSWSEQNLRDGVAIFRDSTKKFGERIPNAWIEYRSDSTIVHDEGRQETLYNGTGRPLMSLLTHKATTKRPFGQSVITKAARSAIEEASRANRQAMIAAYHYNTKVDVILGADEATDVDHIDSQTGDVLKIGTNNNGQIPQIGEFAQHAMTPFSDTILISARNFCSDTKLSLVNLGISTDAPQSTEALEIINDDLRDDILAWQEELGAQLKYFATTLWMLDNDVKQIDANVAEQIDVIKPTFLSVFRQDVARFGDGLTKLAERAPKVVLARSLWRNLGLTSEEIDRAIESAQSEQSE